MAEKFILIITNNINNFILVQFCLFSFVLKYGNV